MMYHYHKPPCQGFQNLKTIIGASLLSLLMTSTLRPSRLSISSKRPLQLIAYDPKLDPHGQHKFNSKGLLDTPVDVEVLCWTVQLDIHDIPSFSFQCHHPFLATKHMTLLTPTFLILLGDIGAVHLRLFSCNVVEQPHKIQTGYSCPIHLAPIYA